MKARASWPVAVFEVYARAEDVRWCKAFYHNAKPVTQESSQKELNKVSSSQRRFTARKISENAKESNINETKFNVHLINVMQQIWVSL